MEQVGLNCVKPRNNLEPVLGEIGEYSNVRSHFFAKISFMFYKLVFELTLFVLQFTMYCGMIIWNRKPLSDIWQGMNAHCYARFLDSYKNNPPT